MVINAYLYVSIRGLIFIREVTVAKSKENL